MSIYLYLDLETMPDDSRRELCGLTEPVELPDPEIFVKGNASDIASWLKDNALGISSEDWLPAVLRAELGGKRRSGVLNAIHAAEGAEVNLIKELSIDPERCKIAAVGWAVEGNEPTALCATDKENDEKVILTRIWELIAYYSDTVVIGFNILGFDLPVICARSIMLGIEPTIQIDWRKYNNPQVIDLMTTRFPHGKAKNLKLLAEQYRIEIPCPDVDGSMVHDMSPDQIAEYVKSDVIVTRELHRKFAGYFCPPIYDKEEKPF